MAAKADEPTYQELAERLDEVTAQLQNPDVTIDDAVALYQQAMELIDKLEQHLSDAENKVREIKARFSRE